MAVLGLLLQVTVMLASWTIQPTAGMIDMQVKPYPALVYAEAEPGVPVLSIVAFETDSDSPLQEISPTNVADADYFDIRQQLRLPKEWVLQVKKKIDKPVGYVFDFTIYGYYNSSMLQDRNVKINVTQKNVHPPSFEKQSYEFVVYRHAILNHLTFLGTVKAVDQDTELYNSVFHYHILDPFASSLFDVDLETGDLEVIEDFPADLKNITFNVTAIDGGSPQLLNTTRVTVDISDVAPPDIFCVAVDDSIARICWKDPTNGSYVMKYELLFQLDGQNTTKIPVNVQGVRDETCSIVRGPQLHRNYTFTVKVYDGMEWSPESLQRKVIVTRKGLYGDCPSFSNCSVWEPCRNGGECLINDDLSYTCNCTEGWGGQNCTAVDLCPTNPCHNGSCQFLGNEKVHCDCPPTSYGNNCQFYNVCTESPCANGSTCRTQPDSGYECDCPPHYVGDRCHLRDPCSPSPCNHGNCTALTDTTFSCDCTYGYHGHQCDKEDACMLHTPCSNGHCHLYNDTSGTADNSSYYCECEQGYEGENCETVNLCKLPESIGFCKNNATCLFIHSNKSDCQCLPGYWGDACQFYNKCFDGPCSANSMCVNNSLSTYRCSCHQGFYGRHCENFDACFSNPCLAGTCHNTTDSEYHCQCPLERYGKNCDKIDGCKIHFCRNNSTCFNISEAGDVACECQPGFVGKFCQDYNACLLSPCQNGAACRNNSLTYICDCQPGYHGNQCQDPDPCMSNPCRNNGNCVPGNGISYWCDCPGLFYGDNCQNLQFCEIREQCKNGGSCILTRNPTVREVTISVSATEIIHGNVSNWFSCGCSSGFTGDHCETRLTACSSNPCGTGRCEELGVYGYICHCMDGSQRRNCGTEICDFSDTYDTTGHYRWPQVRSGVEYSVVCPSGPRHPLMLGHYSYARRTCHLHRDGTTDWLPPDTSECKELKAEEASEKLKDLASFTVDAAHLSPEEIENITGSLEDMFAFSFQDQQIATTMTTVVGNLLEANESVIIESNTKSHSSERLLRLLDQYTSEVPTDNVTSVVTDNINLMVVNVTDSTRHFEYHPELTENMASTKQGIKVTLPAEAISKEDEEDENSRIELMTFRTSSLFIPKVNAPEPEIVMKQWVISATVHGRQLTNLTTPVELRIKNIENAGNHTCVFWDPNNRSWSSEGVVTMYRGRDFTRCFSYHLTSFAIVLDPSPTYILPPDHERVLTYISYIGCGISMLGLLLTIITYSLFRCLNREKSGKILMNLCSSMLLMNVSFVMGSETTSASGADFCKAVSVLLHYFLLTTLMWMCVEAINMYQALITVFTKYSRFFMLKRCIAAWGAPAIVVSIILAVDVDNYKTTTTLCFLSHGNPLAFYIGLLGPACLILLINMAVFIMVSRVIVRPRFKGQVGSSDSLNPAQIRGAFTVMTLLGVTWVFGPFAINEAKIVINYVFTILNSLQGFLIFIFRCCFNPEARMAWIMLIKTGKFKRRKGPMRTAASENTTSSKGDSKVNGSFADSVKSNVYNNFEKSRNGHGRLSSDANMYQQKQSPYTTSTTSVTNGNSYFNDMNSLHNGDRNGITTIYTGHNTRRVSGYGVDNDENTKL